ncbi:MAG: hypothetical protein B7Y25_08365 [Alphaproteobacteria bacterium 16-39-46]|nr:MAG: hypothetical protein B7Y25_08365 [Alphaproteobacteria bacterium 16-39-46]OZA41105.1 MAG: hypothetical protein B7X84_08575 [Alphaproteobacteria bacterium 17-39-52]
MHKPSQNNPISLPFSGLCQSKLYYFVKKNKVSPHSLKKNCYLAEKTLKKEEKDALTQFFVIK